MSEVARISKNSVYSFLSIFFRLFANIILFWLVARFYGKEIFGQFTIAQTFASVFVIFADFGLDILLTTELPRDIRNSTDIFRKYFSIKLVLSLVAFIGMFILSFLSGFSYQVRLLIIIFSFYAAFTTITNFLFALFKGNEKLQYETKVSFLVNFVSLLVILLLILLEQSIIIISISFALMRLIGLFIALYFAYHVLPSISFHLDFSRTKEVINQVIVFGLFLVFGNLYFQLDTILLAFIKDTDSVGIYQAVFRLIMLPLLIPEVLINSIMPALSRLNSQDLPKWEKLGFILNKLLIIVAVPIGITLYVFAPQIINIVYGRQEYAEAVPILRIFAIIVFVRFFAEAYGLMLTTSHRQKTRMYVVIVATFLNLILNLILIPKYGIHGAAFTSLITNIFVAVLFVITTKSIISNWIIAIIKPQLVVVIILMVVTFFVFNLVNIWFISIVPLVLYLVYIYYKVLTESEKKYFYEMKNLIYNKVVK